MIFMHGVQVVVNGVKGGLVGTRSGEFEFICHLRGCHLRGTARLSKLI